MPEAELQVVGGKNHRILDNFGVNDADRQEIEDHLTYLHGKYEHIDGLVVEELSISRLLHAVTDQESRKEIVRVECEGSDEAELLHALQ